MTGLGLKWLEMAGLLEMARNCLTCLAAIGDGLKWLNIARNSWKWLEIGNNGLKCVKIAGNS